VRICTYNVLGFECLPASEAAQKLGGSSSPERTEYFAGVFQELDSDVLAIQEGGAPAKMMQEIAGRLDMYLATIPSPRYWPGHVLSRYPIVESRTFSHFDPRKDTPPLSRCGGAVRLRLPSNQDMWIVNLHLHPSDVSIRVQEAALVERSLDALGIDADAGDMPVVVLGDFNSTFEEDLHQRLVQKGFVNAVRAVQGELPPTMDTFGVSVKKAIDHIYVSSSLEGALRNAFVVRSSGFRSDGPHKQGEWVHSDHLPVVAELAL